MGETFAAILAIILLVCLAGVVYPFKPFGKRWRALLASVVTVAAMAAVLPDEPGNGDTAETKDRPAGRPQTTQAASNTDCGPNAVATGNTYGVTGSSINIRTGPGSQYDRIVNEKATRILKETMYIHIDSTVTIREVCRQGEWSRIQVVEPEYLRDSHRGWVASRFLRNLETDTTGRRVFTENDFIWDDRIRPYKDIIVAGVNKIHRENERCGQIDPSSAYVSSKSTPSDPVFFVTCGSGANVFNVFFSKKDVEADREFRAAGHIDKTNAVALCERYAKSVAAHPSTVDFSRFLDLAVNEHPNGRTTVNSTFTAKNAFNLEIKFQIRCLLNSAGLIEANVVEAVQ